MCLVKKDLEEYVEVSSRGSIHPWKRWTVDMDSIEATGSPRDVVG